MHLDVQLTSPGVQASRHLVIAACAELWAATLVVVVAAVEDDVAEPRAAKAPMMTAETRIVRIGVIKDYTRYARLYVRSHGNSTAASVCVCVCVWCVGRLRRILRNERGGPRSSVKQKAYARLGGRTGSTLYKLASLALTDHIRILALASASAQKQEKN